MVQGLGALVALLGDLSLDPSTHRVAINSIQFQEICHPFLASWETECIDVQTETRANPQEHKNKKMTKIVKMLWQLI